MLGFFDRGSKPRGDLFYEVRRRGELIEVFEEKNLIVDNIKQQLCHLLGGDVSNRSITKIGFGTNGAAPAAGNTSLTGAYVKTIDSVSYPVTSQVAYAFTLGSTEANGLAIMEFGLFTNGNVLVARRVRSSALNKESDITLAGTWTISF